MTKIEILQSLRRPKLLISAARNAGCMYKRGRELRRLLRQEHLPAEGQAFGQVLQLETALNDLRLSGDARYSLPQHIAALTALLWEASVS
jgi:hypothetical protein